MARESHARHVGYTIDQAVSDVFGLLPLWPWSTIAIICLGGVAGAAASQMMKPVDGVPNPALRWAACAGYGIVIAALLTTLPAVGRLVRLRSSLGRRPTDEAREASWWPLRLLAAALRGTPDATRRTQQDFSQAVERGAVAARGTLAHRLWPAWIAAFVAPVLGLLSAWEAGKQIDVIAGQEAAEVLKQFVPQVSPPMVATIAAGLGLMVVLAIIDQANKGILQRWGRAVLLADGHKEAVKSLVGDQVVPSDQRSAGIAEPGGPGSARPQPPATPVREGPSVDDLEVLARAFSSRGKGG